MIQIKQK